MDRPLTGTQAGQSSGGPQQLRPPRNLVSRRAIIYWAARALGGWLVLILVQLALMVLLPDGQLGFASDSAGFTALQARCRAAQLC